LLSHRYSTDHPNPGKDIEDLQLLFKPARIEENVILAISDNFSWCALKHDFKGAVDANIASRQNEIPNDPLVSE
jgi:hypothetical protein